MASCTVARDLMLTNFATVRADQSLGDAMQELIAVQAEDHVPNALVVVDADGDYVGFLTARLLTRSLLALWMPESRLRDDPARHERELLEVVRDRLHVPIRDALLRGIPSIDPEARLLSIIASGTEKRLEFMPVVDGERPVGVLPVTVLFQATARLALTPEDEGIRYDR